MDLVKRLEEYRERERSLSWEGTFAQYFEIATRAHRIHGVYGIIRTRLSPSLSWNDNGTACHLWKVLIGCC